jgi:hypothetical protein
MRNKPFNGWLCLFLLLLPHAALAVPWIAADWAGKEPNFPPGSLFCAVCVFQGVRTLPDEYRTHDLVRLRHLAGLDQHREVNIAFHLNRITEWDVAIRYYAKRYSRREAEKFQESVEEVRRWLNKHLPK